jgi:hypothetical protein
MATGERRGGRGRGPGDAASDYGGRDVRCRAGGATSEAVGCEASGVRREGAIGSGLSGRVAALSRR